MKRNPRKLGWTKAFRRAHGKELTVDSTLAFAAHRNVPVRYNRHLAQETLRAMERIEEVRARRERRMYELRIKQRQALGREQRMEQDRRLVAENQHLLPNEQRRVVVPVAEAAVEEQKVALEEDAEWLGLEEEDVEVPEQKLEHKELKVLVGGGVEEMDVDT